MNAAVYGQMGQTIVNGMGCYCTALSLLVPNNSPNKTVASDFARLRFGSLSAAADFETEYL